MRGREASQWANRLPWALMMVGRTGDLVANERLRDLLHVPATPKALTERFEIGLLGGRPLPDDDLPWRRAARGESFDEEETWYDRQTASRLHLRVRCQGEDEPALLAFDCLSDHPFLLRRSEAAASVAAALLRAEEPAAVAQAIADHVSAAAGADAIFLLELAPREQRLRLLASLGLPASFVDEHRAVSLELPSLLSLTARTQRVQEIDRIEALPDEEDFASTRRLLMLGLHSTVVLPLVIKDELVGVLGLAWRHPGRLNPLERRAVEAVRALCALAIRYAQLRASDRREAERLRTLRDAALAVEDALPLRDLLRRLVEQACELTRARYGALGVLEPDGHGLSDFVYSGVSAGIAEKIGHLPEGHGLLGAVIDEHKAIRVADLRRDPRAVGFPAHHPPMTSFLGVPLRIGRAVFGNFYLCDKEGGAEFTDDDERLLELFAAQSALAVGYARQMNLAERAHHDLDRLHDELSAVIAHDLRSPVATMLLQMASLVAQPGDVVPVPRPILDRLHRCTQRISHMTNDLLDVSRIELERLVLDRHPVSPRAALEALLAQMAPLLEGHPVSLEVHEPVPQVLVDAARFEQVVTNLLENAAKYSGPGAPVRVIVRAPDGGGVTITVEDQGAGIAAEDVPRLFDRFYQSARARKEKRGLGLGLYIARGLVEGHGGRIWVESAPGQGSRFHVWLPCTGAAAGVGASP